MLSTISNSLSIKLLLLLLIADFLSGLFHWIEDAYITEFSRYKFIRDIGIHNKHHHRNPSAILDKSWFNNIKTTLLLTVPCMSLLFAAEFYTGRSFAFFNGVLLLLSFANLIHKWSHAGPNAPYPVKLLHRLKILQTSKHHKIHHKSAILSPPVPGQHFCLLSNILNPVLEYISFWRFLETIVYLTSGHLPIYGL